MALKQITIALLIVGSSVSAVHAAEAAITAVTDTPAAQERTVAAVAKPVAAVESTTVRATAKTREQVIAEVVLAQKDGGSISLGEEYPAAFNFRASR